MRWLCNSLANKPNVLIEFGLGSLNRLGGI